MTEPQEPGGRNPWSPTERWAYRFAGTGHVEPADLADAFAERWNEAAERLREARNARMLREWVEQFDEASGHDVAARDEMLDVLAGEDPVNVRLVAVLRWLAPDREPVFAGAPLGAETLWNLSARAVTPNADSGAEALDLVSEIVDHRLLDVLSETPDGEVLGEIETRRAQAEERWSRAFRETIDDYPDLIARLAEDRLLRAELLNIAVDEERAARRLRGRLSDGQRTALSGGVPRWFTYLLDRAGPDAVRMLLVLRCLPEASAQTSRRLAAAQVEAGGAGPEAPAGPGNGWRQDAGGQGGRAERTGL